MGNKGYCKGARFHTLGVGRKQGAKNGYFHHWVKFVSQHMKMTESGSTRSNHWVEDKCGLESAGYSLLGWNGPRAKLGRRYPNYDFVQ